MEEGSGGIEVVDGKSGSGQSDGAAATRRSRRPMRLSAPRIGASRRHESAHEMLATA